MPNNQKGHTSFHQDIQFHKTNCEKTNKRKSKVETNGIINPCRQRISVFFNTPHDIWQLILHHNVHMIVLCTVYLVDSCPLNTKRPCSAWRSFNSCVCGEVRIIQLQTLFFFKVVQFLASNFDAPLFAYKNLDERPLVFFCFLLFEINTLQAALRGILVVERTSCIITYWRNFV